MSNNILKHRESPHQNGADKTKEVEENDEDGDEDDGAGDDNED